MQALHLWRPTSIEHDRLDLIFDDEIRLSFACAEHIPILASATIELVTPPKTGDGPTEALLVLLRDAIQSILTEKSHQTLPAVSTHLSPI